MNSSDLTISWNYLDTGHCAFKTKSTKPGKIRCSHLFTVTGAHKFTDCPLIQPTYVSFQRQEELVYLIEKHPKEAPASMWGFTELPADREKARKIVEKAVKNLNHDLKQTIWNRFEQQFDVAEVVKASEELKEEEEED
ncbi:MAG: hypothetical protein EAX86_11520 [Candidatus Heimdallarchaeota archaeon]|nr:hypothetical protein [Candidatus Heimdallarchaeota archaeon]